MMAYLTHEWENVSKLQIAASGRVRFRQGTQCLIVFEPNARPLVSHQEARARREKLKEIVARRAAKR